MCLDLLLMVAQAALAALVALAALIALVAQAAQAALVAQTALVAQAAQALRLVPQRFLAYYSVSPTSRLGLSPAWLPFQAAASSSQTAPWPPPRPSASAEPL